jgi:hypothetical protein
MKQLEAVDKKTTWAPRKDELREIAQFFRKKKLKIPFTSERGLAIAENLLKGEVIPSSLVNP